MSNIPSVNQKIQIEATDYRSPVSESLMQTMGGSINYALDTVATNSANIATNTSDITSLDTRLDNLEVLDPTAAACSEVSGTLTGASDSYTWTLPAAQEHLVTAVFSAGSGSGVGTVYLGTDQGYIDSQGFSAGSKIIKTIFVPKNTTTFPSTVDIKIGIDQTILPYVNVSYRLIRRSWVYNGNI